MLPADELADRFWVVVTPTGSWPGSPEAGALLADAFRTSETVGSRYSDLVLLTRTP